LVLANHPGAYDALALMSALGRQDLRILAADRTFLRALPRLSAHLLFVPEQASERAGALKRAVRHLRQGGALLHFPTGQIEPDADFEPEGAALLGPWQPGVSALVAACARVDGRVLVAGVRGVHSPRAKRWLLNRAAERRGITTLSPLLQMVGRLRDVTTRVCCHEVAGGRTLALLSGPEQQAQLRAALEAAIRG
jgi:1-acyl-sn-glycerol-3-phosphate acyltransferase